MPAADVVLEAFKKNNEIAEDFKKYYTTLSTSIPGDSQRQHFQESASKGDPYALAWLGKVFYDEGHKELAFQYFEAVVSKRGYEKKNLAQAIGDSITKPEDHQMKLHFHCLAIREGNEKLYKSYMGGDKIRPDEYNTINYYYARAAALEGKKIKDDRDNKDDWIRVFSTKHPQEFKQFFIKFPAAVLNTVLKVPGVAYDDKFVRSFKRLYREELLDNILRAIYTTSPPKEDQDVIKEFKEGGQYHREYFDGMIESIIVRRNNIEKIHAPNIVFESQATAIKQIRNLLRKMIELNKNNLGGLDLGQVDLGKANPAELSNAENKALNDILDHFSESTTDSKLDETSKTSIQNQEIYLQLQAFKSVLDACDNPSPQVLPSAPGFDEEEDQPGGAAPKSLEQYEEKDSNTEKLLRVRDAVVSADKAIKAENKNECKLAGWKVFVASFALACTGIGIPIVIVGTAYNYSKHRTYNLFATTEEKKESRKAAASKKAEKAFNTAMQQTKKGSDDLPLPKPRK